jgi:hypothetical protein
VYAPVPLFARRRSVLTIHNIGYQGIMPAARRRPRAWAASRRCWTPAIWRTASSTPLKTGIKFADAVTTVSPTYAREICETPLGMGMQQTLRARGRRGRHPERRRLPEWDPRHDPHLTVHFGPEDLRGKRANKRAAACARSGLDLARAAADRHGHPPRGAEGHRPAVRRAAASCCRSAISDLVGAGQRRARYVAFFARPGAALPGPRGVSLGLRRAAGALIEAGSDMFLMPSRYEPCGLNQMYSLRYGTMPIVRRTGGLADSVQHFDPASGEGTGCVFNDYDAPAVRWAMNTTLDWFAPSGVAAVDAKRHGAGLLLGPADRKYERCSATAVAGAGEQRVAASVRQRIAMRDAQPAARDPGRQLGRRVRGSWLEANPGGRRLAAAEFAHPARAAPRVRLAARRSRALTARRCRASGRAPARPSVRAYISTEWRAWSRPAPPGSAAGRLHRPRLPAPTLARSCQASTSR